jgi:hypothetical protein
MEYRVGLQIILMMRRRGVCGTNSQASRGHHLSHPHTHLILLPPLNIFFVESGSGWSWRNEWMFSSFMDQDHGIKNLGSDFNSSLSIPILSFHFQRSTI